MVVSTKFLSAVAVALGVGIVSTSAYMSRGDARRDVTGASREATPSLSERLRAQAHGRSLPWSDPVKTAAIPAASPKLRFTSGPPDEPVERAKSPASEERRPATQATLPTAPVHPPDKRTGQSRITLADRGLHARTAPSVASGVQGTRLGSLDVPQRALNEDSGHIRARVVEAARRRTPKPHPAPSRHLPSLDAVDEARLAAQRPEPSRATSPVPSHYKSVRLAGRDDLDGDAFPPRSAREVNADAPDWSSEDKPHARRRQSVAASDGLMRWLSGPGGRF